MANASACSSGTMGSELTRPSTNGSSVYFSGCIARRRIRAPDWALRSCVKAWSAWAERWGCNLYRGRAVVFISICAYLPNANMTMTVLCVDDSTDDTLLLQHACRRAGVKFALQAVDDGEKAIEYLAGAENFSDRATYPVPRLVLLDLKMPSKTGFEVLEWLRLRPEYKSLQVAVFTSSQHESDIHEAYRKGANCFL